MHPAVVVAVASLGAVALLGSWLTIAGPSAPAPSWTAGPGSRVRSAVDASISSLGRVATSAIVLLAGFAATILSCYVLGKGAHALESAVDVPVFAWFQARQVPGMWHQAWTILTQMGNRSRTQPLALGAAVLLALLWARANRRWWIPLLILPIGYLFEKYGQLFLKLAVHRGHPPTTLGTWPSGGCARLIVVFGLIVYLALRWKGVSRRTWWGSWSVLAFLAAMEAYSRTYLLKHWFTDVLGGLAYGAMALAVLAASAAILDRGQRQGPDRPEPHEAAAEPVGDPKPVMDAASVRGSNPVTGGNPVTGAVLPPSRPGHTERPRDPVAAG